MFAPKSVDDIGGRDLKADSDESERAQICDVWSAKTATDKLNARFKSVRYIVTIAPMLPGEIRNAQAESSGKSRTIVDKSGYRSSS
ncbi:MAG: hypothetical protein WKF71_20690 [Pyrinomonadaceae bacterium]